MLTLTAYYDDDELYGRGVPHVSEASHMRGSTPHPKAGFENVAHLIQWTTPWSRRPNMIQHE